ncbi:uncharacterized protein LOC114262130 [Camellia sinensis]|uniref:uncharacterized protein LOC114262130 n=1 Tax=Camellia sinensis TaxID=4442 RepID=UPI0010364FDC|nr:uncharacterized protein LOC114262130 [Camellia sinensis]
MPEGSIACWAQLTEAFVTRFKMNTKTPVEIDQLLIINMDKKETLKSYNNRYWETFNLIGDCPTNLAIAQNKRGLPVGHKLRYLMTMTSPLTIEALLEIVHQHNRVDEDSARTKVKYGTTVMLDKKPAGKVNTIKKKGRPNNNSRGAPPNDEDAKARRLRVRTAIMNVFKKPICRILSKIYDEPFIRRPAKLGEAHRGYDERDICTFHDEVRHQTEDCMPLRQHLEELMATSHLD